MPSLDTSRRIKRVSVAPAVLAGMLTQPKEGISIEIVNPIPQTAGVVGGAFDYEANCFVLFVADASFEVVAPGAQPPELPIEARAVYGEQNRA